MSLAMTSGAAPAAQPELGLMPFRSNARWRTAASPADRAICGRSSIASPRSAVVEACQFIAVCDADLGYSELNALIAAAAANALRTALGALHNPSSPTVMARMAVEHALRTARRQRTRLTGHVPQPGLETDGLSVLAAVGFGERLIVAGVGACRLWIWRAGLLYPLMQHGGAELVISERTFMPGDRVLLASPVMAEALSDAQIATLCHRQSDEQLLALEFARRAQAANLAGLTACAVITRELSGGPAMARPAAQHPVLAARRAPVRQLTPGRTVARRGSAAVTRTRVRGIRRVSEASLSMMGLVAVSCVTLAAMIALLVLTQQTTPAVTASTQPQSVTAQAAAPAATPQGGALRLPATPTAGPSATAPQSQVLDVLSAAPAVSTPTAAKRSTRAPATASPAATRRATATVSPATTAVATSTAVHVADALPTLTAEPFATAIPVPQP